MGESRLIARIRSGRCCVALGVDLTFSFHGFKYLGRIADQPTPSMGPVLLLGGAFQDRFSWARQQARLEPLATTVTVDLPGSGDAVMGTSYGGTVAYRLAQRHPASVRRLMLCGTALRIPEATRAHARASIDSFLAGDRDGFVRSTIALFLCAESAATIHKRAAVTRLLERQLRALTADQADKYVWNTERVLNSADGDIGAPPTNPVLVVAGEHDTLTTSAMCRATASGCPDARFTTIRHADHLVPIQRADEFADLMVRYFDGQPIDDLPYCNDIEYFSGR
jgi:pimeloyl-ACP methyl ester carboxylesterase